MFAKYSYIRSRHNYSSLKYPDKKKKKKKKKKRLSVSLDELSYQSSLYNDNNNHHNSNNNNNYNYNYNYNHHHHHHHHRIQRRNSRFLTVSSLRREPSPTRTLKWLGHNHVQITCNTTSAYHAQHVVLRATWYEGTAQLLSWTEFKITFI